MVILESDGPWQFREVSDLVSARVMGMILVAMLFGQALLIFILSLIVPPRHGQEPQIGSRGGHAKDNIARASSRWEKQRNESAAATTANARKDSKKETKSKSASKVQKVVQIQPQIIRQSPLEMHAAAQAKGPTVASRAQCVGR